MSTSRRERASPSKTKTSLRAQTLWCGSQLTSLGYLPQSRVLLPQPFCLFFVRLFGRRQHALRHAGEGVALRAGNTSAAFACLSVEASVVFAKNEGGKRSVAPDPRIYLNSRCGKFFEPHPYVIQLVNAMYQEIRQRISPSLLRAARNLF